MASCKSISFHLGEYAMPMRHPMSVLLVTFAFGSIALAKQPVSAVCTTDPLVTYAGATISVHVTPAGFIPKRELTYVYTSTNGEASGDTSTGTVSTDGLDPGKYNVSSLVSDDHKPRHRLVATCQASFTIKELPKYPPKLFVRAEPQSVNSGEPVTITAEGTSRDNRPLSFSCLANRGALAGTGTHYVLDTMGLDSGIVNINCTVQDDRVLSGFAAAQVTVTLPPPASTASQYGEALDFSVDKTRPARVDNVGKGRLDRYADALAAAPDATGVVVGYDSAEERMAKKHRKALPDLAGHRTVNIKAYLVDEKGIDPKRIEVRTGTVDAQKAILWIVPAGAAFESNNTASVDESQVKAVARNIRAAK
jgi:hypothetical protein